MKYLGTVLHTLCYMYFTMLLHNERRMWSLSVPETTYNCVEYDL